ncbi:DeoR/GlpR family DNA-binding transcription regulator [Paraferrimonas haliotis]|uniref:XRE family transcriptional regulator n=1 Tax=Paraferrimonas haliotis TaxID=2013866 RepID=A0AA37WZD0_9GAMM|nr:DeoR family transcriptional regulator [Paraferrimonas haliotis]GLS84785.1 XRE family transcriptional regulator [Paraferrimonas haliotis]
MSKRNTQQRRRNIVEKVNDLGELSVEELALHFETSEVTIRKDLTELERSGLLLRRFGGAVRVPQEFVTDQRVSKAKQAIGALAASLISDHNRVLIDSGRTTSAMIPHLSQKEGLVVMTNSLSVANAIQGLENEPTLLMTGGTWDPHSEAFQGRVAEQVLRSYNFDQLFIGADGIDIERGSTTFNELFGLSKVMAAVSREVIVLVESEKVGRKMPNLELPWAQISALITDCELEKNYQQAIKEHGVQLYLAEL